MGRGGGRHRRGSEDEVNEGKETRRKQTYMREKREVRDGSSDEEGSDREEKRERGEKSRKRKSRRQDPSSEDEDDRIEKEKEKKRKSSRSKRDESTDGEDTSEEEDKHKRRRRDKKGKRRKRSSKSSRRQRDESEESSSSGTDSDSEEEGQKAAASKISEEELREYLAKKAQKKAQKLAKKLRQKDVSGYTNDSNPFGDANLTEKFVWRKKIEKDVLTGQLDPRDITLRKEKERLRSFMEEIEKVKKRREERLLEKARHEEEMALLARERARAEFMDWEEKEDQFHYEQSKVRSEIRLREGRAKPIDVLARNLNLSHDFDVEINEPYKIYKGLTVKEMEDLKEDIKMHLEYDKDNPLHVEFWTAMMVVCHHEIAEATRRDIIDRARVRGEEPPPEVMAEERGLHSAVNADVDNTLATGGSRDLEEMEARIVTQMETGGAKIVEYWESVLKRLKVFKAKARLREIHAELLRQHLSLLQQADERDGGAAAGEEGERDTQEVAEEGGKERAAEAGEAGSYSPELMTEEEAAAEGLIIEDEKKAKETAGGEAGGYSPQLLHAYEGEDVVDPEADKEEQERKRASVIEQQEQQRAGGAVAAGPSPAPDRPGSGADLTPAERAQALKMMGPADGDAILGQGAEVSLESQVYWWHDKFRPRKPKYFNRVHTGYEWNKYNQTHYDHDNPPPKIVQGYKFNIFYPDLIDRTKAPTFSVEKDGSNGETCLIRFHAGPPYEDIAFRIVNKEWEYSHKKGFKGTFDRGILHVYFNFKRYRYRR